MGHFYHNINVNCLEGEKKLSKTTKTVHKTCCEWMWIIMSNNLGYCQGEILLSCSFHTDLRRDSLKVGWAGRASDGIYMTVINVEDLPVHIHTPSCTCCCVYVCFAFLLFWKKSPENSVWSVSFPQPQKKWATERDGSKQLLFTYYSVISSQESKAIANHA